MVCLVSDRGITPSICPFSRRNSAVRGDSALPSTGKRTRYPRPREADQGARLGQQHIAQGPEAGMTPPVVGFARGLRTALSSRGLLHGRGGLGHLGQGEHAFLHARSPTAGDRHEGQSLPHRHFAGRGRFSPTTEPNAAAEEAEIQNGEDGTLAVYLAGSDHGGWKQPSLAACLLESLPVGLLSTKPRGSVG